METPNPGEIVTYVLPTERFAPAMVVRVLDANTLNLVVFAEPEAGKEFATGTAAKLNVPRLERTQEDEYPKPGTWFQPAGQFAPYGIDLLKNRVGGLAEWLKDVADAKHTHSS